MKKPTLRPSVALISAALFVSTSATANMSIGRTPSMFAGGGNAPIVKPNVFLIIDNNEEMGSAHGPGSQSMFAGGNLLQQTAGALIASLPQLEGKVRLGLSTPFRGTGKVLRYGDLCSNLKLNGNVDKIAPNIDALDPTGKTHFRSDVMSNPNYLTAKEDYVFGPWGSGYNQLAPRNFSGNYARYVYAWLGGMCPGSENEKDKVLPYGQPRHTTSANLPPYGDLRDPVQYKKAAIAAGNEFSLPLANWSSDNVFKSSHNPILDVYTRVLGIVSDSNFLGQLVSSNKVAGVQPTRLGDIDVTAENGSHPADTTPRYFLDFRDSSYFPGDKGKNGSNGDFTFDAYAPERADNGYPDNKNPVSCRKNYSIIISLDAYSTPSGYRENADVGTDAGGFDGRGNWTMPDGKPFPLADYTRMYRYQPLDGIPGKVYGIPRASFTVDGQTYFVQGSAGSFLFSKLALQSYYRDLRSNLKNDVPPYYAVMGRKNGFNDAPIPKEWDRKNDFAPWQHMTIYTLGFMNVFSSWQRAQIYKNNFKDIKIDPATGYAVDGALEPYFRAVEGGKIYESNPPLIDWGRGGFGPILFGNQDPQDGDGKDLSYYIYKRPDNSTEDYRIVEEDDLFGGHCGKNIFCKNHKPDVAFSYNLGFDALSFMDYAKAGTNTRGGAYPITDYRSIKKVIEQIAKTIKDAMVQGITGGAISGGGRVTASQQAAGGNDSVLFTTYLDQKNAAGNIFAFKNCPLIEQKIVDKASGAIIDNPLWAQNNCGKRLWNAATVLYNDRQNLSKKTIVPLKTGKTLTGGNFAWDGLDNELKSKLQAGGDATLGKARVDWLNGKLVKEFTDPKISAQLRTRFTIAIPDEKQNYAVDDHGNIIRDQNGNIQKANLTSIPDLIGEIVYGTPKAVDNRGTLPAAHPLNDDKYREFVKNTVMNRQPLVLAGSNDGRLYAFNNASDRKGQEHNASFAFSFIPRHVITKERDNLANFTQKLLDPKRQGLVNGPFTVRDVLINGQWRTYLVGTLGEGGGVVYALDISNGRANPQMFRWETDNKYGSIMADPRIVWLRKKCDTVSCPAEGKWVVLVPTGYNTQYRHDPLDVALVVLDLEDGHELGRIETTARYTNTEGEKDQNGNYICHLVKTLTATEKADPGAEEVHKNLEPEATITGDLDPNIGPCENGLGPLTVFDADSDSGADYVFAGDLMGHVWKFDLSNFFQTDASKPQFAVSYHAPLFIAQSPGACDCAPRQPITSMIEIDDGAYGEGSMLYFGTGRLFTQQERNDKQVQSFYGIWDIPRFSHQANITGFKLPLRRQGSTRYDFLHYSVVNVDQSAVASPDSSLAKFKELRTVKRDDNLSSEKFLTFDLQGQPVDNNAKAVGWIIDFPAGSAGERVLGRANSFEDAVFFPSFTPNAATHGDPCRPQESAVGGDARFYMIDRLTGGELEKSPFDFSHDGTQNADDGINVTPDKVDNGGDIQRLGYNKITDSNGKINVSPAGVMVGRGNGDFLTVTGVLERAAQATKTYNCDYSRQVVFPSTVDPATGNPLVLSSCNRNRYRVWKQPAIE